jgi:hypothetical protein
MNEYQINPADRTVCFGQLFGMCDYISFYLGILSNYFFILNLFKN